jgi:hypothetical protein
MGKQRRLLLHRQVNDRVKRNNGRQRTCRQVQRRHIRAEKAGRRHKPLRSFDLYRRNIHPRYLILLRQ